jgi:glucokinase
MTSTSPRSPLSEATATSRNILAADLGGTHCRFARFTQDDDGWLTLRTTACLATASLGSSAGMLAALAEADLGLSPETVDAAVFAVPGAVVGRRIRFANIDWLLDQDEIEVAFGPGRVACVNDFLAQALGCGTVATATAERIRPGEMDQDRIQAVIGAGTGLGHAALLPLPGGEVLPMACEKGQTAMSFGDPVEQAFARYLGRLTGEGYARLDSVLSGSGLARLHCFLTGEHLTAAEVGARLTPESRTTALFARFYGRAARDFALTVLPAGGLYLCGGVAANNPLLVRHPEFTREFLDSPTYGGFLASIPVRLVRNENTGLFGAARYAATLLSPSS